jgi:16S rRNA (uracil1498-N3)-methyltransferase
MVEREHRASVATFYAPGAWNADVTLSEAAAHHAQVKRLETGDVVTLTSGDGRLAQGLIASLSRRGLTVSVDPASIEQVPAFPRIELCAPIGDRDRMLWLAEKSVELGVTSWRSVMFARSRSVSPRGEGAGFRQKIQARQVSALEQSGGAWLPELHEDGVMGDLLSTGDEEPSVMRLLLDFDGERLADVVGDVRPPVAITFGPEGGLHEDERAQLIQAGWRPVSLAANVLRFETAGIAALAIVRSHLG